MGRPRGVGGGNGGGEGWKGATRTQRRRSPRAGVVIVQNLTRLIVAPPGGPSPESYFLGSRRSSSLLPVGVGPHRGTRNPQGALPGDPGGRAFPLGSLPEPGTRRQVRGGAKGGTGAKHLEAPRPADPLPPKQRVRREFQNGRRGRGRPGGPIRVRFRGDGRVRCSAFGAGARRRRTNDDEPTLAPPRPRILPVESSPLRLCRERGTGVRG